MSPFFSLVSLLPFTQCRVRVTYHGPSNFGANFRPCACALYLPPFSLSLSELLRVTRVWQATAMMYYKRFFLVCSCMDYDPVRIMLTCIYLAGKVRQSLSHVRCMYRVLISFS